MKNHEEMLKRQRNQPTSPFQFDEGKQKNGEEEKNLN